MAQQVTLDTSTAEIVMPKAPKVPEFPLQGLIPIEKPSGPTSMRLIDMIKPLLAESKFFHDANNAAQRAKEASGKRLSFKQKKELQRSTMKIGQGGTLDPLADGVLVIGVNKGTKHLSTFLHCTKTYVATGLLGCYTTSYDAEGSVVGTAPYEHVTKEMVQKGLSRFKGKVRQIPPIFSALKMDGKPLYEYARENIPLPRPIASRVVDISELVLLNFTPASSSTNPNGHSYKWPQEKLNAAEVQTYRNLMSLAAKAGVENPEEKNAEASSSATIEAAEEVAGEGSEAASGEADPTIIPTEEQQGDPNDMDPFNEVEDESKPRPATFEIRMTVSSGTYVRSIVHDLAISLGSAAHVVKLTRVKQGEFPLWDLEDPKWKTIGGPPGAFDKKKRRHDGEEEETANAASSSTAADKGKAKAQDDDEYFVYDPNGPDRFDFGARKGGCVPWSVWEKAIKEREEELAKKKAEKLVPPPEQETNEEDAMNQDPSAEQSTKWVPKEWEREVWARFVEKTGGRSSIDVRGRRKYHERAHFGVVAMDRDM